MHPSNKENVDINQSKSTKGIRKIQNGSDYSTQITDLTKDNTSSNNEKNNNEIKPKNKDENATDEEVEKEEDENNVEIALTSKLIASMAHNQTLYHEQMLNFNQQQLKNQSSTLSSIKAFVTNSSESFKFLKDNSNQTLNLMQESNIRSANLANQTLKILQQFNMQNEMNSKFRSFNKISTPIYSPSNVEDLAITTALECNSSTSSSSAEILIENSADSSPTKHATKRPCDTTDLNQNKKSKLNNDITTEVAKICKSNEATNE